MGGWPTPAGRMRNSNLLKWAHNNKQTDKSGNRSWIHPPDALQKGHIAYLVKFLGTTEVDQPKGIEVVKEGIRKLKFSQQIRKSEGTKTPKVELTISIDGVAVQEPKTKRILHQYPLHRISYCADDKGEKKFFSFIAKESPDSEQHSCYVFVSDKLAEEITLTIGQAFDLAYKRFLETAGRDLEVQRRLIVMQQRVKRLETENTVLRQRLTDMMVGQDVEEYMRKNNITDMLEVNHVNDNTSVASTASTEPLYSSPNTNGNSSGSQKKRNLLVNLSSSSSSGSLNNGSTVAPPPPVPPRQNSGSNFNTQTFGDISDLDVNVPSVGTKLEGLLMDELEEDFNPRAYEQGNSQPEQQQAFNGSAAPTPAPLLAPPPKAARDPARRSIQVNNGQKEDIFGSTPFNIPTPTPRTNANPIAASPDPFGMGDFGASGTEPSQSDFENAIGLLDKKILEMKDGFSRGLSFGNEDFSLESLDPLRK